MRSLKKMTWLAMFLILTAACKKEDAPTNPTTDDGRYQNLVFNNVDNQSNVVYGNSTTQGGVNEDLLMDIYTPQGDVATNRPLIILAHGGGFFVGEKESMSDLATFFARSGYVAVSLKYRLVDVEPSPAIMKKGVIDAVHDMRAAIRFFRKDLATNNNYKIDDNNIFVGGYSAGGFMGLHTAYLNSMAEINEIGGEELSNYVTASGGLEGNSGNAGYSSSVKGAISLAGALVYANLINAGEPVLYSFHGTSDSVVPYTSGDADGSGVITEGPSLYHPVAEALGIKNRLYSVDGGEHDVFWSTEGAYEDLRQFIYSNLDQ